MKRNLAPNGSSSPARDGKIGQLILDQALPHFLHRGAFELMGKAAVRLAQADPGAPAELVRALGGDIDKEEAAVDGRRWLERVGLGEFWWLIDGVRHDRTRLARKSG